MALTVGMRSVRRTPTAARAVSGDICVVGSGIAGISAAIEAARLGRRVVLVEGGPVLGGQSVGAALGTFCGFYGNGPDFEQVTHGIADEILHALRASGNAADIHGRRNTIIVQYRIEALARWVEEAVRREPGITVLLGAVLREVRRDGRRIRGLALATRYGDVEVIADGFVDATGDAVVAWLAGMELREADIPVYGSMMLVLENVDHAALAAIDREELKARLAAAGSRYGLLRQDGFIFPGPGPDEALVNMTHFETPLDPVAASRTTLEARAQGDRLVEFLKAEYPAAFAATRVRNYGQPGVRQTRTIAGGYTLTADDVRTGRPFTDAVVRCSWPIEFHDRPEGVHWEEFGDGHMHYVPLRSLTPAETDNLTAAGRCIDADPIALSSVRVMGPCIAMGAAAAHALDLAGSGGSVHQIDLAALRRRPAAKLGIDPG